MIVYVPLVIIYIGVSFWTGIVKIKILIACSADAITFDKM